VITININNLELFYFIQIQLNLSREDSKSLTDKSLNPIGIGILDKMEPIRGNPKFLRILSETQKPVK